MKIRLGWLSLVMLGAAAVSAEAATPVYVPVRALLNERLLVSEWDAALRNLTARGPGGAKLKVHAGSRYMLVSDKVVDLGGEVVERDGVLQAPRIFIRYLDRLEAGAVSELKTRTIVTPGRVKKIVVDAGHGGHDPGAVRPGGLQEKELALDIARQVAELLGKKGAEVHLTRQTDTFLTLVERAATARRIEADLFVSIHVNASTDPKVRGFEVYYLSDAADDLAIAAERAENASVEGAREDLYPASTDLEKVVWDIKASRNREASLGQARRVEEAARRAGVGLKYSVRAAQFYVLKWNERPAILVETGYLSNEEDAALLADPAWRAKMAAAIVEGLWSDGEKETAKA